MHVVKAKRHHLAVGIAGGGIWHRAHHRLRRMVDHDRPNDSGSAQRRAHVLGIALRSDFPHQSSHPVVRCWHRRRKAYLRHTRSLGGTPPGEGQASERSPWSHPLRETSGFPTKKNAERPTLEHIHLEALPGQTVAFVGPTGAGKINIAGAVNALL